MNLDFLQFQDCVFFSGSGRCSCNSYLLQTLSRYRGEGVGGVGGDPYEEVYSNAGVGSPISPDYRGPKVNSFLHCCGSVNIFFRIPICEYIILIANPDPGGQLFTDPDKPKLFRIKIFGNRWIILFLGIEKRKNKFTYWQHVDNLYPCEDNAVKKVSKLRFIAEPKAFDSILHYFHVIFPTKIGHEDQINPFQKIYSRNI